jgi:glycosyltransferase involved in cell wall biosynthesis
MMRVAIVTEIPAPYRIPLFNALAGRPDVDLLVLFLGDHDPTHPYPVYADEFAFSSRVLGGRGVVRARRWLVVSRGLGRALRRFRPDAIVVGGWNQPAFWQALLYGRLRRVPVLAWVESTRRDARSGGGPNELLKRLFVRAVAGFIVPGGASREYVELIGGRPETVSVAPNAVDGEIFGTRVDEARRDRDAWRRGRRIEGCLFLFVGRLEPEKGLDVLLEAMQDVPAELAVIGSGSAEAELRARAPKNVTFLGRIERDELPAWYAGADAFVLPSRSDQWGMVLNEAAAAGLPIVASEAAGAAWELVEDGVSGFRVAVQDPEALAAALVRLAADAAFRADAAARTKQLAESFTPAAWSASVADACAAAVSR